MFNNEQNPKPKTLGNIMYSITTLKNGERAVKVGKTSKRGFSYLKDTVGLPERELQQIVNQKNAEEHIQKARALTDTLDIERAKEVGRDAHLFLVDKVDMRVINEDPECPLFDPSAYRA